MGKQLLGPLLDSTISQMCYQTISRFLKTVSFCNRRTLVGAVRCEFLFWPALRRRIGIRTAQVEWLHFQIGAGTESYTPLLSLSADAEALCAGQSAQSVNRREILTPAFLSRSTG